MATNSAHPVTRRQAHRTPTAAAACEACRKLKMRCIRSPSSAGSVDSMEPCDRCLRNNRTCRIPPPRPLGRKPGAVGRYKGLEKAYRKMQAELKKAGTGLIPIEEHSEIHHILSGVQNTRIEEDSGVARTCNERTMDDGYAFSHSVDDNIHGSPRRTEQGQEVPATNFVPNAPYGIQDPISNPLALLADASETAQVMNMSYVPMNTCSTTEGGKGHGQSIGEERIGRYLLRRPRHVSLNLQLTKDQLETGLDMLFDSTPQLSQYQDYFRRHEQRPPRDTGPDLDPVDLGLISMEEATELFAIYFQRLHPINGILDPHLHTSAYVRSHSALLFTWILALTAQFDHDSAIIARRLLLHGDKLSRHVHTSGYKSVEIVQGYYISLLSATPAKTLSEERSWLYTMYAVGVAMELGLDQGASLPPQYLSTNHDAVADNLEHLQRVARNRERTWLRILFWERANSAAYGRSNAFPETQLTQSVETWWMHPLADQTDKYTCAFILLRRHLAALQLELRRQAGLSQSNPRWVAELIDVTLGPWCRMWLQDPYPLPPSERLSQFFLYYVYLHNRLWTLSFALHASLSAGRQVDAIREDCFNAALHSCEVAVRDLEAIGEPLYCMLAPTWAMISYAAILTLKLYPHIHGAHAGSEIELLALLAQVAMQLQKAGATPSHRLGIAALLAQHLLLILRAKAAGIRDMVEIIDEPLCRSSNNSVFGTSRDPDARAISSLSPLVSSYDPILSAATLEPDSVTTLFREIFGPGFDEIS